MIPVTRGWTLFARVSSMASALALSGCNVSRHASDTGGVDLIGADAGDCPSGLVIASSDYASTNVSLANASGAVVSESILSSASAPPGLTTALSGDVVLPSAPPRSRRIVLVDRYPNAVLTWVDPSTAKVEKQLSVGTGFAANPHDYLEIGDKAYVSRYESNPSAGAEPYDAGGDLLILDPSAPAVTGRISLASPDDGSLLPRADRMIEVGGEIWVVLQRFDADFKTAGDARIAGVSPETDAVVWTRDLTGVASCGAMASSPSRRFVAVSCTGLLARPGEAVSRSALVVLDAEARPPVEVKRFAVAAELGAPLAPTLAFASEDLLVGVAFGNLHEGRHDIAYTVDLSTGKTEKLAVAARAFVYGDVRCSPGCGDLCFLTDADSQTLRVWKANGSFLEVRVPEAVDPSIGLPPVSSDISDGAFPGNHPGMLRYVQRMRSVLTLLVALVGGCNVYDGSLVQGSGGSGNATHPSGTAGGQSDGGSSGDAGAGGSAGTGGSGETGGSTSGAVGAVGTGGSGETSASGTDTTSSASTTGGVSGAAGSGGSMLGTGGRGSGGAAGTGGSSSGGSEAGSAGGSVGAGGTNGAAGAAGTGVILDASADVTARDAASVCAPGACKRVFLSSQSPAPSGKLGGIAGGDAFCQTTANAHQLGGAWKAWLSDATSSPSARFVRATVPYRLLDGSLVANDWTALTSGTLAHAINVFEDGTTVEAGTNFEVWTGTSAAGVYSSYSCSNWTNDTATAPTGMVGVSDLTNAGWTIIYQQFCNRTTLHLYCFEQ